MYAGLRINMYNVQDISGGSHILTFSYDVSYRCVSSALA